MIRKASIDIGTNSTRLLIADIGPLGKIIPILMQERITRLGLGVDSSGALAKEAIKRVYSALKEYKQYCSDFSVSNIKIIATSATRDSLNREQFLNGITARMNVKPRVLSGEEEAYFSFRGVISDMPLREQSLVCDIGGGSTEFILAEKSHILKKKSINFGSLRLTEKFIDNDPPTIEENNSILQFVKERLSENFSKALISKGIFVGGTATTLAKIDGKMELSDASKAHKYCLDKEALEKIVERLKVMKIKEREKLKGLLPERSPVILTGALIVQSVMEFFSLGKINISIKDLLFGILLE